MSIDITFCNQENKEILQLKKYINDNNFNNYKNIVIVAYSHIVLINLLTF